MEESTLSNQPGSLDTVYDDIKSFSRAEEDKFSNLGRKRVNIYYVFTQVIRSEYD